MNNYIKNIMCNIFKKLNGMSSICVQSKFQFNNFFFEKKNNWKKPFSIVCFKLTGLRSISWSYLHDIILFYLYESAFADINILGTHFNWDFEMNFIEKSRNFFFRASGKNDRVKKTFVTHNHQMNHINQIQSKYVNTEKLEHMNIELGFT